jgi:hypothetical protein
MKPSEIEDSNFTVDIQDNIASAKSIIEEIDFDLYVYKVGAFSSPETVTKIIESFGDNGFPAFAKPNESNKTLTTVLSDLLCLKTTFELIKLYLIRLQVLLQEKLSLGIHRLY